MSQPQNLTDTQGLLQSMLQRLKLQPGREGQSLPSSPVTSPAAPWNQGEDKGRSNSEKLHNVNGFEPKTNGVSSKLFGVPAVESNFSSKGGETQQPIQSPDIDRTTFSSPTSKDNNDNAASGRRVLGEATKPGIIPAGTRESLPAKSLSDHNISPLKKSEGEKFTLGSPATLRQTAGDKSTVPNSEQQQGKIEDFTPRLYAWSPKGEDNKTSHGENGGFGDFGQSKGVLFVASSPTATNSSVKRGQRSDSKKRRWTQKLKDKWLDRSGGKRGKEQGGGADHQAEHGTEITGNANASTGDSEATPALLDSSDLSETLTVISEDDPSDDRTRSSTDFDFGLGSFSLLEEISTGQEWAKFLNPGVTAASTVQNQSEELQSQLQGRPNGHDSGRSSLMWSQQTGGHGHFSFAGTGSTPIPYFGSTRTSPDAFQPVSMDVSEGKGRQQPDVHRAADQSEPMEEERGRRQQHRPPSLTEPAGNAIHSALKNVHQNRKRQHGSPGREETLHVSPEKTGAVLSSAYGRDDAQHDVDMTSNPTTLISVTPTFKPFASPSRSVLKHAESLDWSSMETETKRRRVEENRRVRFAEEVVTIDPPEHVMDATDSEEEEDDNDDGDEDESGADNDSVNDHDSVQSATPAAPPTGAAAAAAAIRRPGLPAWIQALKRRNTGRRRSYRL